MKKIKVYVDMDGVLADFNGEVNAVERFKVEKDFFLNLKPILENVSAVKMMLKKGYDVTILTTSPHKKADKAKKKWLKKFLPEVKAIYARPNKAKIDYIKEKDIAVLFDDYGKNIKEWQKGGGYKAFKITPKSSIFTGIKEI